MVSDVEYAEANEARMNLIKESNEQFVVLRRVSILS